MFVCVVSLSQMLSVKCLCVLSRFLRCYLSNVCVCCLVISDVICQMFVCIVSLFQMLSVKCLCVLPRYLICYLLNVCVCCLVISDVIC